MVQTGSSEKPHTRLTSWNRVISPQLFTSTLPEMYIVPVLRREWTAVLSPEPLRKMAAAGKDGESLVVTSP